MSKFEVTLFWPKIDVVTVAEVNSSVENIDSATLRDKLARYYRTGTFHEDDLAKNYKKSNDSLRTYLLNKKE
mgnify:CR=1 FL=1